MSAARDQFAVIGPASVWSHASIAAGVPRTVTCRSLFMVLLRLGEMVCCFASRARSAPCAGSRLRTNGGTTAEAAPSSGQPVVDDPLVHTPAGRPRNKAMLEHMP